MTAITSDRPDFLARLNGPAHRATLTVFMVVVLAHWAEHVAQAIQIWGLGWKRPQARGLLGMAFPWLISSEALHYGYALVMLTFLFLLRPGFTGRARTWWTVALVIQFWHHIEHLLLLIQAQSGWYLAGRKVPTSIVQLAFPGARVELHLFYNTVVFIPMVIAMYLHLRPSESEYKSMTCSCRAVAVAQS